MNWKICKLYLKQFLQVELEKKEMFKYTKILLNSDIKFCSHVWMLKDAQHCSLLEKCKSQNYNEISPHTSQNDHRQKVYKQ